MKIGIISLNPGHNYGGMLQSYALKTVLERMGHEVRVICRKRELQKSYSLLKLHRYLIRIYLILFKGSDVRVFFEAYQNRMNRKKFRETWRFCKSYLKLREVFSFSDIKPKEFDAFVVGSDQVWRPRYFEKQYESGIENAYLSFANNWEVKRIAYAPSFGVDEWEYTAEQTQHCAALLSQFDAISVRETDGVRLCKENLSGKDPIQLCDPTLLLTKKDYESLITSDTPPSKGNLLVYCLDESDELNKLVERISKEKQLKPFRTNAKKGPELTIEERKLPSVESWLRAFQDAEFVITDSFHACVFSLIFHKPFLVFGNKTRGMSRFDTLLSAFGQGQRQLSSADEYDESISYPSLDNADEIIAQLRIQSLDFLNKALG